MTINFLASDCFATCILFMIALYAILSGLYDVVLKSVTGKRYLMGGWTFVLIGVGALYIAVLSIIRGAQ